jgi:hypothetical protein
LFKYFGQLKHGWRKIHPLLQFPKALSINSFMAGLLTYPGPVKPSHDACGTVAGILQNHHRNERSGFTAAGTVADSDRIPFSSCLSMTPKTITNIHEKIIRIQNNTLRI